MNPSKLLTDIRLTAQKADLADELWISAHGILSTEQTPPEKTSLSHVVNTVSSTVYQIFTKQSPSVQEEDLLKGKTKNIGSTISILKQIFGSNRLERSLDLLRLDTKKTKPPEKGFSKKDFSTLLLCLSLVTKEDLEELLLEIQSENPSVRSLTNESLQKIRAQFATKTLSQCSKQDIECLESILLPFSSLNDLFWEDASHSENDVHAPTTFFGVIEKAAWAKVLLQSQLLTQDEWETIFAKAFSPPLLPNHLVIPHAKGFLYMSHVVEGGGASKRFFTPLGLSSLDPIILYRSTRCLLPTDKFKDSFESVIENLRRKFASFGCIATYDQTKELLNNPASGFVKSVDQMVHLIGYSQGGVHAQRDCTLPLLHRVKKLTTVSSPGTDRPTAALFRKVIEEKKTPLIISHITEVGDVASLSGEEHLWASKNVELTVRSLVPALGDVEDISLKKAWWVALDLRHLVKTLNGFSQAHSRLTVAAMYKEKVLQMNNPQAISFCQHDPSFIHPSWEFARKLACIFPSYDFAAFAEKLHKK